MEVKRENPAWLDKSHPNYFRWEKSRKLSADRGKFVYSIVSQSLVCKGLTILDLGSGEGGTVKVFSQDNFVVSFDISLIRLQRQREIVIPKDPDLIRESEESVVKIQGNFSPSNSFEMNGLNLVNGTALQLPFSDQAFDLIIIQDVIEHLSDTGLFYTEIKRIIKSNGSIYLSTPNKLSVFNFISDPHFGLPVISMLKRNSIKKYFLKYFRKSDYNRKDIAQLLSLIDLLNLFMNDFSININTKYSVKELFKGNKGIVWSDFHLKLISFCKIISLDIFVNAIANDHPGYINKYFTPTFYLILKRKN